MDTGKSMKNIKRKKCSISQILQICHSAAIEYAQMQRAPSATPSVQSAAQRGHLDQNRTAKQVYEYMSSQLESSQILSLEIQEKYGKS